MAVSTRELFILGAVSRNPIHGHGINRIIEISGADQWVELGEKHVYYVLRKLEAAGLIQARTLVCNGHDSDNASLCLAARQLDIKIQNLK